MDAFDSLFDDNDYKERLEKRIANYYGPYSTEQRQKLMSKNLVSPTSVYDVLYPTTRQDLLSKNVASIKDLEEDSKSIRDNLLSKLVEKEISLEKQSEDFRKAQLAKNNLTSSDILANSEQIREDSLAKNAPKNSDLEKDSEQYRQDDLSKNAPKGNDLEKDSEQYRQDDLANNTPKGNDLEKDSEQYRQDDLAKNASKGSDLEKDSEQYRQDDLAKNAPKGNDLEKDSEQYRQDDLAKNAPSGSDLEKDSEQYRDRDVHKNVPDQSDLLADSEQFRNRDIHKNVPKNSDLESDSEQYRDRDIHKNVPKQSDLLADSEAFRNEDLNKNNPPKETDLAQEFEEKRKESLIKNVPNDSDLLSDSEQYRTEGISKNVTKESSLETDSVPFREDDLSQNKTKETNLEVDSVQFREDDLSLNTPNGSDLEVDSVPFRDDDLSLNVPNGSDLEVDSVPFRDDDLSLNVPNGSDLEVDSVPFRDDDLSLNVPNGSDLEVDSVPFRDDDLSLNVPNGSDLEVDSVQFRDDDLALNVPNGSDLEVDSVPFRDDDLSANVPSTSDLLTDSEPFRDDDLSANVPSTSDLLTDSETFRDDDLSANVSNESNLIVDSEDTLNSNLALNVPVDSDLLSDSNIFRGDNLSANVPEASNLLSDSDDFRADNVSANIPKTSSLLLDSKQFREDLQSKNNFGGLFGVNVNAVGTSQFVGVSRVLVQGELFRQILKRRNQEKDQDLLRDSEEFKNANVNGNFGSAPNQGKPNEYTLAGNQYDESSSPSLLEDSEAFYSEVMFNEAVPLVGGGINERLQGFYGTTPTNTEKDKDYTIGTGDDIYDLTQKRSSGSITDAIREFSLSRNSVNIQGVNPGSLDGLSILKNHTAEGFQDLIERTIGELNNNRVGDQVRPNTTPEGENYLGPNQFDPEGAVRIDPGKESLGSALSMAGKDIAGNPFFDPEFKAGTKGVRRIINTIKNDTSESIEFSRNFDVQNNQVYIVGRDQFGGQKKTRQRFTIANPYAPERAEKLLFYIENYSIDGNDPENPKRMHFPPYIKTFQHSENANWNAINFLGRTEPLYTYNNSTRDGSMTFMVLTDYASSVDIGRNYDDENSEDFIDKIQSDFTGIHWTDYEITVEETGLEAEINDLNSQITELKDKIDVANENGSDVAEFKSDLAQIRSEKSSLEEKQREIDTKKSISSNYSESNDRVKNINDFGITNNSGRDGGNLVGNIEDTATRLDDMKQSLMFQPSFFSGDDLDFIRRIEFLAKTTKPANNYSNSGFSFNKPPVCHIHLGTWLNHDVVINSVSFDYSDVPWNFTGERAQPMWATVTLNFNIIGAYRHTERPLTSTDVGGYFGRRKRHS